MDDIVVDANLAVPLDRSWELCTTDEGLGSWLAPQARVGSAVGELFELFWDPEHPERNSTIGCRITAWEPVRSFSIEWKGPAEFAPLMNTEPLPTWARFELRPVPADNTRIRVTHGGWGDQPGLVEAREWQEIAWRTAFDRLVSYVRT